MIDTVISISAVKADGTTASEYQQNTYAKTGGLTQQKNGALTVDYTYDNQGRNISQ